MIEYLCCISFLFSQVTPFNSSVYVGILSCYLFILNHSPFGGYRIGFYRAFYHGSNHAHVFHGESSIGKCTYKISYILVTGYIVPVFTSKLHECYIIVRDILYTFSSYILIHRVKRVKRGKHLFSGRCL